MVGVLQVLANKTMVVDLTVGGNGNGLIGVGEGLSTGLNTDDRKTLMAEDCVRRIMSANSIPSSSSQFWILGFGKGVVILVLWQVTLPPVQRKAIVSQVFSN